MGTVSRVLRNPEPRMLLPLPHSKISVCAGSFSKRKNAGRQNVARERLPRVLEESHCAHHCANEWAYQRAHTGANRFADDDAHQDTNS